MSEIGVQIGKAGGEITGGAGDIFSKAWKEEGVGGHLELFGEQMSKTISALESLPEKVRATEAGFGGEIDRTTRQLAETTMNLTGSLDRTAMVGWTVPHSATRFLQFLQSSSPFEGIRYSYWHRH